MSQQINTLPLNGRYLFILSRPVWLALCLSEFESRRGPLFAFACERHECDRHLPLANNAPVFPFVNQHQPLTASLLPDRDDQAPTRGQLID